MQRKLFAAACWTYRTYIVAIILLAVSGCSSGDTRKAVLSENPPPHKYHAGDKITFKDRDSVKIEGTSESFSIVHGPLYRVMDYEYYINQDVFEDFLDKLVVNGTLVKYQ